MLGNDDVPKISTLSVCNDAIRSIYGPSSSHTYAPARIAYHASKLFGQPSGTAEVKISLFGGKEKAFKGHGTDRAIIGGLLGFSPYTDEFKRIKKIKLAINGDKVKVENFPYFFRFYINESLKIQNAAFGIEINIRDSQKNLSLAATSVGGGRVEIRSFSATPENLFPPDIIEKAYDIETPGFPVPQEQIEELLKSKYNFSTFDQLKKIAEEEGTTISEIVIKREEIITGEERSHLFEHMKENWELMKRNIKEGLAKKHWGEISQSIAMNITNKLPIEISLPKSWLYAMAASLAAASGERIVSCPTAGAAGILPGVIYSIYEMLKEKEENIEEKILQSLFTAGIVALIIQSKASVSGAQHGCQAECGVARAMAAAFITEVYGGDPSQVIDAVSLSIKNSLGLTCDPVGGLVEIPCIKRNAIFAIAAYADAILSLTGYNSLIPVDEVIEVMKEVGEDLPQKYKETGEGGLATTPTAITIFENLLKNSPRYKIPYIHFQEGGKFFL